MVRNRHFVTWVYRPVFVGMEAGRPVGRLADNLSER